MFSAVAENPPDSVQDGPCVASALGIVAANGQVSQLHALQGAPKVEGIAVKFEDDAWVVTMVTDANDPAAASQLLQARMPMAMASKLPEA